MITRIIGLGLIGLSLGITTATAVVELKCKSDRIPLQQMGQVTAAGTLFGAEAPCPSDFMGVATGGGIQIDAGDAVIVQNRPDPSRSDAWICRARGVNIAGFCYAKCCKIE